MEHLFHQPPEQGQGANGAGLAERQQEPGAGALQPEAAMGVGVSVCGGHGGAAQDAQAGEAWAEPWGVGVGPWELVDAPSAQLGSASALRLVFNWL